MPTFYERLPATKTDPKPGLNWVPADDGSPVAGVLSVFCGRCDCDYEVTEFPADFHGRAFHLRKLDTGKDCTEGSYSCFVGSNMQDRLCECKGFYYAGKCKHLAALEALILNGWL